MKNNNWMNLVCLLLSVLSGYAQLINRDLDFNQDQFKNVQIAYSKTTSIVFPYSIKSIDKGSQDILMQKAKGVENILLLKAANQNFMQTNITVVTADSRLYVFVLNYDEVCPDLNIKADNSAIVNNDILFSLDNENQKKIEQYSKLALFKKKKIGGLKRSRFDINLSVNGIFIHQDVLYFRLVLGNASKINYDIDQLRFFIRDQRKSKRTASQEIEILPLFSTSNSMQIPDKSEVNLVYALSKFTIPEKKYLTIQLIEKDGGRQLEIDIKNNDLIDLDVLNSF
ncbi:MULTISPECIES: conjugative transposon protein TraN [Flavobacterium]|uniref:Conjugative transposon TraN protein n=1 Tax=Flavobacterium cutihirudinis TaxID=1265740 RepID=A0A3D9G1J2_9FLAO|nr:MULTISPECIES: conjugative transposon protein TraN [Flavobacterium]MBZ4040967.1 conjugative transposon protein TraN [Flavobacterium hibisci]RED27033.1 conjugative transposon TraN protein [Flavobacterium cutihirudinis]